MEEVHIIVQIVKNSCQFMFNRVKWLVFCVNRCKNRKSGMMKKTKIVCSIGPASCSVDTMTQMVNVGMNVARINFSHATLEENKML